MGSSTSSAIASRRARPGTAPATPLQQQQQQQSQDPSTCEDPAAAELAAHLDAWQILVHAKQHYAQRLAVVDCFNTAAIYPEDCANISTYGQLYDHVLNLAGHLQSLGIGRGSRVAVMLRNCAEVRRGRMQICPHQGPNALCAGCMSATTNLHQHDCSALRNCSVAVALQPDTINACTPTPSAPPSCTPSHSSCTIHHPAPVSADTPPPPQVPALHFAAAALRAIIVNINVNLAPQELAHILADSGADIIVASPEFAEALQAAADAASTATTAAAIAAAEAEAAFPAPGAAASASVAADVGALCVHAAVWTLPGQPLQTLTPAAASSTRLPQVSGWHSCAYPYGVYVRTDITGAPVVLSADVAGVTNEEDQALDELYAFGGRPEGDPEDGYQMYFTSGTTGRPKGVLLNHRVVVLHAIGTILGE